MRRKKIIDRLEETIKKNIERADRLNDRIYKLENPILVEPFNEVEVDIVMTCYNYGADPFDEKYKGVAKVLDAEVGMHPLSGETTRLYDLLIKEKSGKEYRVTVSQMNFEEGIKRAKK